MKPIKVDGWNVAHLAGGLLLSSNDFLLQLSSKQVDAFIDVLNSETPGKIRDESGNIVLVIPKQDHVILKRTDDKVYPDGIILPVDAFSDFEDENVNESLRPAFKRVGSKIKRGYRVTTGRHKGQVVSNPATAHKPPVSGQLHAKLSAAAKRHKLIRALKSKLTRRKSVSIRLRRLNDKE